MESPVGYMILKAMELSKTCQSKVCRATGISKGQLSMVISGKRNLTPEIAKKLDAAIKHFDGLNATIEQYKHCEI